MNPIRASVLIPVKNGGSLLGEVLDAVLAQQTLWPFEVIVVDSGSRDGSVECARQRGVRVECIPSAEFGHGRTRNYLASLSRGDFLVFITQDAKPEHAHWLQNLVEGCDSAPEVAGAFGPHRAHPGARHITERELAEHFAGFGASLSRVRMEDPERFEREAGYRQWLHFFSNNNSCLRRTVWQTLPFPEVMFAEDQTWMLAAIKAGYSKAFVPDAMVYHSHDFGVWETLQRNFDEARSFQRDFGYDIQRSLVRALVSAAALMRRDARWLYQAGLRGAAWMKTTGYMGGIELARTLGQFLGTRHRGLPKWLLRVVSRDEALQRGRSV
ncbi:MAG TPA: glycosyltransferase family 2 protein [Acidovorax sp.]|nr:glycosyltransferase family 2 protein [Acidovorax sp.]